MKKLRKAVFPVAGFGTRFLPATKSSSKEMMPIVDKPLIHYAVLDAVEAGIEQVIFVTGRGKRAIEDYFDISFELEYNLKLQGKEDLIDKIRKISDMADFVYIRQKEPRGLGHAVLRAKEIVGDEPFAVVLPDDIIDSTISSIHQLANMYNMYHCSILGLKEVDYESVDQYGIVNGVSIDDSLYRLDEFVEKPKKEDAKSNLAIIGRYVLTSRIFEELENTEVDARREIQLTDAISSLAKKEAVYGYVLDGKRYDCGNKLGFLKATVHFALQDEGTSTYFRQFLKEVLYAEQGDTKE